MEKSVKFISAIKDATNQIFVYLKFNQCMEKGWLPSAKLKPTFTFLGRNFAIFNTFSWQNPYQEK